MDNYFIIMTTDGFEVPDGPISEILTKVNNEKEARQFIKNYIDNLVKDLGLNDDDNYDIEDDRLIVDDEDYKYIFTIQKFN